jgi:hypothetical protein
VTTATGTVIGEEVRLRALADLGLAGTAPEERFDRVTRLCRRLFDVPIALVNLVGRETLFVKSRQGIDVCEMPRDEAFCATAIGREDVLVVPDAPADERFAALPAVAGPPGVRFYAGVPLRAPGGQAVGTVCLMDTRARDFGAEDSALLRDVGRIVERELAVDEELERAGAVQRALFPDRPPADGRWDVAGACVPAREVGGDLYDWHRAPAGLVVALADVMGKGLPAAIVGASLRAALRAGTRRADLAEGLEAVAWTLATDLEVTGTFATVLLARLEAEGQVTVVDAGHAHVAVLRAGGAVEPLVHRGLPLGIDPGEHYVAEALELAPGETLLAHSDGLVELPGGPTTTEEAARLIAGAGCAADAVRTLMGVAGERAPADDVTVVVARRRA